MSVLKIGGVSYDDGVNWIVHPDVDLGAFTRQLHFVEPPGRAKPIHTATNYRRTEVRLAWTMAADSLAALYSMHAQLAAEFDDVPTTLEIGLDAGTTKTYLLWPPEEFPDLILGESTIPTLFQFVVPTFEIRPTRWAFAEVGGS